MTGMDLGASIGLPASLEDLRERELSPLPEEEEWD
jgi:hypothetical protein